MTSGGLTLYDMSLDARQHHMDDVRWHFSLTPT